MKNNDQFKFTGMETIGLEFFGSIPLECAIKLSNKNLKFQYTDTSQVKVSITAFIIENLAVKNLPLLKFTYPEALFSLEIYVDAKPARLAIKAYTSPSMYFPLSQVDKYNTSLAKFIFKQQKENGQLVLRHQKTMFKIGYQKLERVNKSSPFQRLFTQKKIGKIYEIPWGNDLPEHTYKISYNIEDLTLVQSILGEQVELCPQAFLYLNRPHSCSPAIASSIQNKEE